MICQNIVWLTWPPPLLRTAVRIFSGHLVEVAHQILDGEVSELRLSCSAVFRLLT